MIHADRSFEMPIWILAILKTGACYVVLDKSLPMARKQAIARVAEAQHLVTDSAHDSIFDQCDMVPQVTNILLRRDFASGRPLPIKGQRPDDLAYSRFCLL